MWAGEGKPPLGGVIVRASEGREEAQNQEGRELREVTRAQRGEGHVAGAV